MSRQQQVAQATTLDLPCPGGHTIRQDALLLEHGAVRCRHREPDPRTRQAGGHPCGRWVYVLIGDHVKGIVHRALVIPASYAELLEICEARLAPERAVEWLLTRPALN